VVKEISVKLSEDLYNELEKLAEKTNKSKADIVRDALITYLGIGATNEKPVKSFTHKEITAIYHGKCSKCNRDIKPGDRVVYCKLVYEDNSQRTLLYCLDCWLDLNDSTIVKLELKRKS
jgi:Ribbon-helix-helix protein, copG family.